MWNANAMNAVLHGASDGNGWTCTDFSGGFVDFFKKFSIVWEGCWVARVKSKPIKVWCDGKLCNLPHTKDDTICPSILVFSNSNGRRCWVSCISGWCIVAIHHCWLWEWGGRESASGFCQRKCQPENTLKLSSWWAMMTLRAVPQARGKVPSCWTGSHWSLQISQMLQLGVVNYVVCQFGVIVIIFSVLGLLTAISQSSMASSIPLVVAEGLTRNHALLMPKWVTF